MLIFVRPHETEILNIGISYLRIEGAFYCGIGILFLLYGYYRAIRMPGMSVVLTVVSLGTRVALSYWLAGIPAIGVIGIWWSIPIGWFIADVIGIIYYKQLKRKQQRKYQHHDNAHNNLQRQPYLYIIHKGILSGGHHQRIGRSGEWRSETHTCPQCHRKEKGTGLTPICVALCIAIGARSTAVAVLLINIVIREVVK